MNGNDRNTRHDLKICKISPLKSALYWLTIESAGKEGSSCSIIGDSTERGLTWHGDVWNKLVSLKNPHVENCQRKSYSTPSKALSTTSWLALLGKRASAALSSAFIPG